MMRIAVGHPKDLSDSYLRFLDHVGFEGCINPDHIPTIEGDYADGMTGDQISHQGLSYAVGYIKALLAALAVNR